jgi:hypothetical protein
MLGAAVRVEMIFDMECGGCRSWSPPCRFQVVSKSFPSRSSRRTSNNVASRPCPVTPSRRQEGSEALRHNIISFVSTSSALRSALAAVASRPPSHRCGIAFRSCILKWPDVDTRKLHASAGGPFLWRSARICLFLPQRYQ